MKYLNKNADATRALMGATIGGVSGALASRGFSDKRSAPITGAILGAAVGATIGSGHRAKTLTKGLSSKATASTPKLLTAGKLQSAGNTGSILRTTIHTGNVQGPIRMRPSMQNAFNNATDISFRKVSALQKQILRQLIKEGNLMKYMNKYAGGKQALVGAAIGVPMGAIMGAGFSEPDNMGGGAIVGALAGAAIGSAAGGFGLMKTVKTVEKPAATMGELVEKNLGKILPKQDKTAIKYTTEQLMRRKAKTTNMGKKFLVDYTGGVDAAVFDDAGRLLVQRRVPKPVRMYPKEIAKTSSAKSKAVEFLNKLRANAPYHAIAKADMALGVRARQAQEIAVKVTHYTPSGKKLKLMVPEIVTPGNKLSKSKITGSNKSLLWK